MIKVNRNAYTIAIFEFLKTREPLLEFSYIGIKLAPVGICLIFSKHSFSRCRPYAIFAELHPPARLNYNLSNIEADIDGLPLAV